jgi:hypothetical protein
MEAARRIVHGLRSKAPRFGSWRGLLIGCLARVARGLPASTRERGILDPVAVEDILARQQRGEPRGFQIWTMMILELWYRECLESDGNVL